VGQFAPPDALPQHTETQWFPDETVTVAVVVSVAPAPVSVPGAAPPAFWSTPNHGSAPMANAVLAGVALMVTGPAATQMVCVFEFDSGVLPTPTEQPLLSTVSATGVLALQPLLPSPPELDAPWSVIPLSSPGAPSLPELDPPSEPELELPSVPELEPSLRESELASCGPASCTVAGDPPPLLLAHPPPAPVSSAMAAMPANPIEPVASMMCISDLQSGAAADFRCRKQRQGQS
jgi:hypothetical protein